MLQEVEGWALRITWADCSEHRAYLWLSPPLPGNPSAQPTLSAVSLHFYRHHCSTAAAWALKASLLERSSLQTTPGDHFKMCLLLQAMDYEDSIFHSFLIHQIRCLFLEPCPHGFLSQGHFWMVTHYITLLLDISCAYQHIIEAINIIFTSYILLMININITKWIRKKNTTPYHQGSVRKTHHSGDLTQGFGAHTSTSFRRFNSGAWNWMQLLTGL